ncbi:diflavin oxidoreductase [Acidiferrobacter sp.]
MSSLLEGLSHEQVAWVSGYLAGLGAAPLAVSQADHVASRSEVTVLHGSQTGNAERLARALHADLMARGFAARLDSLGTYPTARLKRERVLLLVTSTYGEGEPPDTAQAFYAFLMGERAPRLEPMKFAVLALGDRAYERFCQTGRDIDARLEALGATRLHPRGECDLDYEEAARIWAEQVLKALAAESAPSAAPALRLVSSGPASDRAHPCPATLVENTRITGRGSSKDVRHVALAPATSLVFAPGDALGVVPRNDLRLVEVFLEAARLQGGEKVSDTRGGETDLAQALATRFEIRALSRPFLAHWARWTEAPALQAMLEPGGADELKAYVGCRDLTDVMRAFPVEGLTARDLMAALRPLAPRLYSIASSAKADPDHIHLTVGVVRYEHQGRLHRGVASTWLAERVESGAEVPVYVHVNERFRLPEDPATPILMVGAGTGVAPFRAFLEERALLGATGAHWLVVGDRQFRQDFLYQREWLDYRRKGILQRLDAAFSRDGGVKTYVQHRLLAASREVYAWLAEGGHLYVCGDAATMAPDVHAALIEIVARERSVAREEATDYLHALMAEGRYQRDIY